MKVRSGPGLPCRRGGSPARVNNLTIHPNSDTPPLTLGANSYLLHIVVILDIPTKSYFQEQQLRHLGEWKRQQKLPSLAQALLLPSCGPPLVPARSAPALR